MNRFRAEIARFSRFSVVGILNNVFLYLLFIALVTIGAPPVSGADACYLIGVLTSYLLNRRWVFLSPNAHAEDLPRFLFAYALGFLCAVLAISILVRFFPPSIAQVFNIGITAVFIYAILCLLGFGRAGRGRSY